MTIFITFRCLDCGTELDGNETDIKPCDKCIEKAQADGYECEKNKGYHKGYHKGYADAKNGIERKK